MMCSARKLAGFTLLLLLTSSRAARGSGSAPAEFRVESTLVLVPVTVTDRGGAYIPELPRERFTLLDNRVSQPITAFYGVDAPCALGVVLDISGSVNGRLPDQKVAARAAVDSLNPEDRFFLMSVSTSPTLLSGTGNDPAALAEAMLSLRAGGWTALYDTIGRAVSGVRSVARPRRALLVISDGVDNRSRLTRTELLRAVEEADVRVYCVAVELPAAGRKPIERIEEQRGLAFLDDLARRSGGFCLRAGDRLDPQTAGRRIAAALHNQYVLGYPAPRSGSGKWHSIQVKIDRRNSHVYARSGYREP